MKVLVLSLAAAATLAAPLQAMSVAEFLGKTDALYARGMMALFSPDIKVLKAEGMASTQAWRAQAHRPNACPPPGPVKINQDDYLGMLRAVPPAQRTQSVSQAVTNAMNKRFPCA